MNLFRKRKKAAAGSITLYVSLIMLVLLSLIYAAYSSARQAAGRVVLAAAAEQSLYSAFAQYDRELFDRYGLLFIDGGYGSSRLQMGTMLSEFRENAEYIADPHKETLPVGSDILGVKIDADDTSLLGYVLATDSSGAAFQRQCCEQMTAQLGERAIEEIIHRVSEENAACEDQSSRQRGYSSANAQQYYDEDQNNPIDVGEIELSGNPVEQVQIQKLMGIFRLVLPAGTTVSDAAVDKSTLVSGRSLQSGVQMIPTSWEGVSAKWLELELLAEEFPCYTSDYDDTGLQYQVEYAIAGRNTDRKNLKAVMQRLLVMREAANFVYLMTSPTRRAEADAAAESICAMLLVPELAPALSFAIKVAWAYGESILDLQELYAGGQIPLMKDDSSWQLSIYHIGSLTGSAASDRHSSSNGLKYEEYLRILLMTKSESSLNASLMDLTEYNIRNTDGHADFRLDCCVDAVNTELEGIIGDNHYTVQRSYGYDME